MKYTQSRIINTKENSKNYSTEFLKNINETLRKFDFKTKIDRTSVEFDRVSRSLDANTRRDAFRNLRTGRIDLFILSKNIIKIKSTIDLSHLTFLSLFLGLCIFLFGWFWNSNLLGIGIFSVICMIITFSIGWVRVTDKIDKIIEKAKEKT